jgi:predicted acyl esterase
MRSLTLAADGSLGGEGEGRLSITSPEITGLEGGFWCPFGNPGDWAPDQRGEEGRSLYFTSPPLEHRIELLGRPLAFYDVVDDASGRRRAKLPPA